MLKRKRHLDNGGKLEDNPFVIDREEYLLNIPYNINLPEPRLSLKDGGKIYIKPSHRGRFTALKERTGHSTTWFKENGTPAQKKMATFALNAAKWKH